MNRRSFIRKIIYIVCIGILLVPLSYYSQPATVAAGNERQASSGGKLAQLREKDQIGASSLGEIDPTGETIKLATLGLRGVAVTLLWEKAKTAQMKEDWDGLQATLDQLTKLEPHFHKFWRHQAWNVSYNISVEWDDYHDRYHWVKEGIKLLLEGMRYNDREALLVYDIGWTTAQKMGVADEKVQYRRLFHEDDDDEFPAHEGRRKPPTHPGRPLSRRDNWLVGQEYYHRAISLVEDRRGSIHHMNPLIFFSEPAMCQIDYAMNLEEDGIFEEKAKVAWTEADDYWNKYGSRAIPSTIGIEIRLNDEEDLHQRADELVKQIKA
ncbi:MAG TPA: IRE (iron responsive element), partial [Pirellulales bacterium]|nr:IRE (iron responsive element) [Pirellulales bacterium]